MPTGDKMAVLGFALRLQFYRNLDMCSAFQMQMVPLDEIWVQLKSMVKPVAA